MLILVFLEPHLLILPVSKEKKCFVIDKRPRLGRNVYCENMEEINVHKYGAHIFHTRVKDMPNYQGNAVVNYTSHDQPYTRIIEHKHFEMFGQEVYNCSKTIISEEYSTEYKEGMEPYYPVNDNRNNVLAEEYRKLAEKEKGVIFGGRLAQYRYYDMAPVIEEVMKLFGKI